MENKQSHNSCLVRWPLYDSPAIYARHLALRLRIDHHLQGPPYSPGTVAAQAGISVRRAAIPAQALYNDSSEAPVVLLNDANGGVGNWREHQMRFSLAHELGHYFLREAIRYRLPEARFLPDDPIEERFCDLFAAELLMPAERLSAQLAHSPLTPDSIQELAATYEVTLQAMMRRITELLEFKIICMLSVEDDHGRPRCIWSSPSKYQRALLCDTSRTSIERAAAGITEQLYSTLDVVLDGRRQRWHSLSKRLVSTGKVLTLMSRGKHLPATWLSYRIPARIPSKLKQKQMSLPWSK